MFWFCCRLYIPAIFGILLSLTSLVEAADQPAPASDCARAKTAVDKALCTAPELSTADAAMANAYSSLKADLPSGQQSALLADQRRWLRLRDALCATRAIVT